MPQDKRLIVTKAVVQRVKRVRGEEKKDPSGDAIYLDFIVPSIVLQRDQTLGEKVWVFPHPVYEANGRGTALICPLEVATSCARINKRHKYFDAVVPLESIMKNDTDSSKRALQVAETFQRFVTDEHTAMRLPTSITNKCRGRATAGSSGPESDPMLRKSMTIIPDLASCQGRDLTFYLSQGAKGMQLVTNKSGQCRIRVGHGGMTAGDICENAKTFVFALKSGFPGIDKYISEVKLGSTCTAQLRFMELSIQK